MSPRAGAYVGKGIPMQDVARFTRGRGRYINDLPLSGVAHVAFVRSSIAHGRIAGVDVERARSHPEAIAVFTAADLGPVLVNRYWGGWEGTASADYLPLAADKVRWAGEPIVAVLAQSRYVAEDLAELVEVDYEPLDPVVDSERALNDASVRLYEEWPDNVYFHEEFVGGDPEAIIARAEHVIRRRFRSQRQTGVPLETRGVVASWDPGQRALTVYANVQDVFLARAVLARVLDLPHHSIRVIAPDTGGGFGVKLPVYPEELACCCMAMVLDGRWGVKWIQDRQEDLIGTTQARDVLADVELAHDEHGRVLALKTKVISDGGAYGLPARGNTTEGVLAVKELTGPYDIADYAYVLDIVMTNKPPIHPYRGVALPVSTCIIEMLMEDVAKRTGIDRREVRRANLVKEFPYQSVTGWVHEPGSYIAALDSALELVGYNEFPELKRKMRAEGRYFGLGISSGCELTGPGATWYAERGVPISSQEACRIGVDPGGKVHVQMGTTAQGQGIGTAIAQVVADELGVAIDDVTISMGDTAAAPHGGGAWGSRQAMLGGSAAVVATRRLRQKLLSIAGWLLEADPEDLEMNDGRAEVVGDARSNVTLAEIAETAYYKTAHLPPGVEPALEERAHFEPPASTHSNAAHATIVEVDPDTGRIEFRDYAIVQDSGVIINPLIVAGQLYGATAQGIGGVVHERVVYDETGQPQATTLMDYLIPSSLDVPVLRIEYMETRSPNTPLGAKGVGESGTCFAPAAVATAVADALDVEVERFAFSPSDIHALLVKAGIA